MDILQFLCILGLGFGYTKLVWDKFLLPRKRSEFKKLIGKPDKAKDLVAKFRRNTNKKTVFQLLASLTIPSLIILPSFTLLLDSLESGVGFSLIFLGGGILGGYVRLKNLRKKGTQPGLPMRTMDKMRQIALKALIADDSEMSHVLLKGAIQSETPSVALNAVVALSESQSPLSVPLLESALLHSRWKVVYFAAAGLIQKDFERFEEKVPVLVKSKSSEVRRLVAREAGNFSRETQLFLFNVLKREQIQDIRNTVWKLNEQLTSVDTLKILEKWASDPAVSELRQPLETLIHIFKNGTQDATRAVRVVVGSPPEWEPILPLLKELKQIPPSQASEAIVRHLGKMRTSQSRTALAWLLRAESQRIVQMVLEELSADEGFEFQLFRDPLRSQSHGIIKGVLSFAYNRKEAPHFELAREYYHSGWRKGIRLAAIRLLERVEPSRRQQALLRYSYLSSDEFALMANRVVIRQSDLRHLSLLKMLYSGARTPAGSQSFGVRQPANSVVGTAIKNRILNTGKMLIDRNSVGSAISEELICRVCFARSLKGKFGPWEIQLCRDCGNPWHLIPGVKSLIGIVGKGFQPVGEPEDGELKVDVWNGEQQTVRKTDMDILRIEGGDSINYDWAVNAVLEKHRNHAINPESLKIQLINQPPLSENTKRMLGKYESL